jgi:hypothetical protein
MRYVSALLVALVLAQPALVLARDRYRLPEGKRLKIEQRTYQGYTLEEMKVLLKMDVDLEMYSKEIPKFREIIADKTELASELRKIIDAKDEQIRIVSTDKDRLFTKWAEENRKRHLAENKPNWGSWLGWTAAAAMTIVSVTLAVTLIVKEAK